MADTLEALLKFTPDRLPLTGKIYGENRNLKAEVEAIRNNWFCNCKPKKKLEPKMKKQFETSLSWWPGYIHGLRRVRQRCTKKRKASGYDASTFTWGHEKFKNHMAVLFAAEVQKRVPCGRWLVLDDFAKHKNKKSYGNLRTLTAMKEAGLDTSCVYISNPGQRQAAAARLAGAVVAQELCEKALTSVWENVTFSAAYLDICGGSLCYLASLVDLAMHNHHHVGGSFVLGITLTGRDSQGQNMLERVVAADTMMSLKGLQPLGPELRDRLFQFKPKSVVTMFYVKVEEEDKQNVVVSAPPVVVVAEPPSSSASSSVYDKKQKQPKRRRLTSEKVAEIIDCLCEPCSIEEASSIKEIREAFKALGLDNVDLRACNLDDSGRRQRGGNDKRFKYFVYKFKGDDDGVEKKPMKLRDIVLID